MCARQSFSHSVCPGRHPTRPKTVPNMTAPAPVSILKAGRSAVHHGESVITRVRNTSLNLRMGRSFFAFLDGNGLHVARATNRDLTGRTLRSAHQPVAV